MPSGRRASLVPDVHAREAGWRGARWMSDYKYRKVATLDFSNHKVIETEGQGQGVTWLDVDPVEQRYLLAGHANGAVALYDVQVPSKVDANTRIHCAQSGVDRRTPGGHQYLVSGVTWYPIDTGLFVSGSFDAQVNLWDTNRMELACQFEMGSRVYGVAMSPVASTHCLVAVGTEGPHVKLCDPGCGACTHTLTGHRDSVWALHWSLRNEYQLVTGGVDGELRLWDTRRSGCLSMFDQHYTQRSRQQMPSGMAWLPGSSITNQTATNVTAHDGAITGVVPTPNGLHWLSAATDSRMRIWDAMYFTNELVNYPGSYNRSMKARQLAVSDTDLVFHPSGSVVQVFDVATGDLQKLLRGHMDTINCCTYNTNTQELYSGGNDGSTIVWGLLEADGNIDSAGDGDQWSDED
ncbi:unnamed protein product [Ostreobium quekettii]|uniref:DNA excision repair protein ERCC-8 n=1 Tax=Ostreobium quekettii TaxID=121088 RepID=A0A8S1J5U8_9CHLO|nr:unnamed protein product [Ostreobium quekettii]|eukprot:evm.model.scf_195.12 EVM.evm.TU.scf_195.12   scf_195:81846-84162(+)